MLSAGPGGGPGSRGGVLGQDEQPAGGQPGLGQLSGSAGAAGWPDRLAQEPVAGCQVLGRTHHLQRCAAASPLGPESREAEE